MKNGFITKKEETKGNKDKLLFYHFMHHGNENIKQHTGKNQLRKEIKKTISQSLVLLRIEPQ